MLGIIAKIGAVVASVATKVTASIGGVVGVVLNAVATEGTTTTVIDSGLVTELIDLCKTCMGLFTEFPLNVFLIAGLVGIGFGIFKMAKRAAKRD